MNGSRSLEHRASGGFTLMELVIVMAIVPIVGLAIGHLMSRMAQAQNGAVQSVAFTGLVSIVQTTMQNEVICKANLAGHTFDAGTLQPISFNDLHYPNSSTAIVANGYLYQGMSITGITLQDFVAITPGVSYQATIQISGSRASGTFLGSPTANASIPVLIQTTTSGSTATITDCGLGTSAINSVTSYNVQWGANNLALGTHAYCALSGINGGPPGGVLQVYPCAAGLQIGGYNGNDHIPGPVTGAPPYAWCATALDFGYSHWAPDIDVMCIN